MHHMYYYSSPANPAAFLAVAFVLSLIGGIVLYFTFLNKQNEHKYTGFVKWLYDFLSFHKLMIDSLLKVLYLILACFTTLSGIIMMVYSFLTGLLVLVAGNVALRLIYEFMMLLIIICQNTNDLNRKLGSNAGFKENTSSPEFVSDFGIPNVNHHDQPGSAMQSQIDPQSYTQSQPQETDTKTSSPKICPKCGTILPTDAMFCGNCGEKQ